jgi:hypothetical protein
MGNIRNDRRTTRWPFGVVPYSIDAPISQIGRQQITTAMTTWSSVAPVRFVERQDENDFITFNIRNDECFSMVGRAGGRQLIGCEFPISPVVAVGSRLAFENQIGDQVDCVFVGIDGAVYVMWTVAPAVWSNPVGLTPLNTAPSGTPVTLHYQGSTNQLDALFVNGTGVVNVMWVVDAGAWQGPVGLTPLNTAPAGSPVGIAAHAGDLLEAFVVSGGNVPSTLSVRGLQPWSAVSQMGTGFGTRAIVHELGHALGLFHEHQRPDRNAFVTYNAGNVQAGKQGDFNIPPQAQPLGRYDYGSVMHYSIPPRLVPRSPCTIRSIPGSSTRYSSTTTA